MKRRNFLSSLGVTGLGLTVAEKAKAFQSLSGAAATSYNVVVVGGGMGGTTVAKYLRLWSGGMVNVKLIVPSTTYYSNIFSNMVLTGERTLSSLAYTYSKISSAYGVQVITGVVNSIDSGGKSVTLQDGSTHSYDRLVLATGIDFDYTPLPFTKDGSGNPIMGNIVHAWQAGDQTNTLKTQIQGMTNKDTFILYIPPKPYRCPPGPYERACVVADYLKRVKGGGKVIVLDANSGGITAEPVNFGNAFKKTHSTVIKYYYDVTLTSIDAGTLTIQGSGRDFAGTDIYYKTTPVKANFSFTGKVINIIPPHKAPKLIFDTGLNFVTDPVTKATISGKWAGVNEVTYESLVKPFIHIVGDSSGTLKQPKAGHIANAEAKVCAEAIIKLLQGQTPNPKPITNSSCFTPITSTTASWLSAVYRCNNGYMDTWSGVTSQFGVAATESNGASSHNYEDMRAWFTNLMDDTFGTEVR